MRVVVAGADRWGGVAGAGDQPAQRRPGTQRLGDGLVAGVGPARQLAQRLGERQVGQADRAEVDAVSDENGRAGGAGPAAELGEQPGLAHSGVAGQQHRGRPPGPGALDRGGQPGQLLRPADQRRFRPQPRHK